MQTASTSRSELVENVLDGTPGRVMHWHLDAATKDGDGNYIAMFAGATAGITGLGRR